MPKWNKGQQEVLDSIHDNSNILVSAAAGSGKTAVLVERIIRTVLEGDASIDEILVVTFTRAAASQMSAKIISALEKAVSERPESNMARQLMLAETADIMTIDSFCGKIVRENFQVAGVDPSFDIYDNEEIVLLMEGVLDEILDKHYRDDEAFRQLAHFLMKKNLSDELLREFIFNIFKVSESFANPVKWLNEAKCEVKRLDETGSCPWIDNYKEYIRSLARGYQDHLKRLADEVSALASENADTSAKLYDMYISDANIMRTISEKQTLKEMAAALPARWSMFPKKKAENILGPDKVRILTYERDKIKQSVKGIYIEEALSEEIRNSSDYTECLVDIVLEFREALLKEKEKAGKYEFSDISHAAYKILYDIEKDEPSDIGKRMAEIYKYIYIDEYQDSNDLQENIINSVARRDENQNINNIFMVGDIKQSIYRFRLARPDLFADKSEKYGKGEAGRLISLNMNYRSRKEVLDATNFVFREVMSREFGGIQYDESAELHVPEIDDYLANFPIAKANVSGVPELILLDTMTADEEKAKPVLSTDEQEAFIIGRRILELVNGDKEKNILPLMVRNEKYKPDRPISEHNPVYRPVRYSDIVILQRAVHGTFSMTRIYEQMGIPVTMEDGKGYFDAMEIVTMMSVLRIIDNIQQDIPLASVLLSEIGGFTDEELALITSLSEDRYISLADKMSHFEKGYLGRDSEEGRVAAKIHEFMAILGQWTLMKPYLSIAELIDNIIRDTKYDEFVAAMPDGKKRVANLKLLKIRADHFESVKNKGLLDFLNYIDKCQIHELDFGEASVTDKADDSVTIMSIHKSKGLEFPVVFVARLGHQFRLKEMTDSVVVDSDYYISMDNFFYTGDNIMVRKGSLKKDVIRLLASKSMKTEEARLLYVAMTRAKEKLIMTGAFNKPVPVLPITCSSMLDYIRYAMERREVAGCMEVSIVSQYEADTEFQKKFVASSLDYSRDMEKLIQLIGLKTEDVDTENPYLYNYPYAEMTRSKAKLSVSEIKHSEMEKNLELLNSSAETDFIPDILESGEELPSQDGEEDENVNAAELEELRSKAAMRGTIIHYLFEKLDYGAVLKRTGLADEFRRVLSESRFSDEEKALVNIKGLTIFYSEKEDSLFSRMKKAYLNGKLYREQQFITGLSNDEIPGRKTSGDKSNNDLTVVQGIIDAFFYEPDEDGGEHIILVDYKTDNVKDGQELLERYASQMYLYALTLEKLTGYKVKDVILYSTRFGEVHYSDWKSYVN